VGVLEVRLEYYGDKTVGERFSPQATLEDVALIGELMSFISLDKGCPDFLEVSISEEVSLEMDFKETIVKMNNSFYEKNGQVDFEGLRLPILELLSFGSKHSIRIGRVRKVGGQDFVVKPLLQKMFVCTLVRDSTLPCEAGVWNHKNGEYEYLSDVYEKRPELSGDILALALLSQDGHGFGINRQRAVLESVVVEDLLGKEALFTCSTKSLCLVTANEEITGDFFDAYCKIAYLALLEKGVMRVLMNCGENLETKDLMNRYEKVFYNYQLIEVTDDEVGKSLYQNLALQLRLDDFRQLLSDRVSSLYALHNVEANAELIQEIQAAKETVSRQSLLWRYTGMVVLWCFIGLMEFVLFRNVLAALIREGPYEDMMRFLVIALTSAFLCLGIHLIAKHVKKGGTAGVGAWKLSD
jgi:hypothetical protein